MTKTNIRKAKLRVNAELHDCLDCEGCICEEVCKEQEEKYFGKEEGD